MTSQLWTQGGNPSTVGCTLVGLLAAGAVNAAEIQGPLQALKRPSFYWAVHKSNSTPLANAKVSDANAQDTFESGAARAFVAFSASQIPLDPDIAKVIAQNRWDLYAR